MAARADSRPLVALAVLFAASAMAYARFPTGTVNPAFIAFLLPGAAATIYLLMRLLAAHDPVRRGNGAFARTYGAILFRIVLFIAALHGTVLVGLLGRGILWRGGRLVPRVAPALLGLAFVAIGNLLPRIRPNVAIGIRTARTLRDREAWLRVNRIAGYVAVSLGAVIVFAALLIPPGRQVAPVVGAAGLIAVVVLVACTWRDAHDRSEAAR